MGGVSETGPVEAIDRGANGGGVGMCLFSEEEINFAYRELGFVSVHPSYETNSNCIRRIEDGQVHNGGCDKAREWLNLRGIRRGIVSRLESGTDPMHRQIDPVQCANAVFTDFLFIEGLRNGTVRPLRDDIQPRSTGGEKLDGKARVKRCKVYHTIHQQMARQFQRCKDDYLASCYLLGADSRGIVRGAVHLIGLGGDDGCDEYPGHSRNVMSSAYLKLVKRKLNPMGFARLHENASGEFIDADFHSKFDGFLLIDFNEDGISARIVGQDGDLEYAVVR